MPIFAIAYPIKDPMEKVTRDPTRHIVTNDPIEGQLRIFWLIPLRYWFSRYIVLSGGNRTHSVFESVVVVEAGLSKANAAGKNKAQQDRTHGRIVHQQHENELLVTMLNMFIGFRMTDFSHDAARLVHGVFNLFFLALAGPCDELIGRTANATGTGTAWTTVFASYWQFDGWDPLKKNVRTHLFRAVFILIFAQVDAGAWHYFWAVCGYAIAR